MESCELKTLYKCRTGSHAYGTNIATSDLDTRGFGVPAKKYILGFAQSFEQLEDKKTDTVIYDLRKYFRLATNGNPSVLEMLFVSPEDIILLHPLAEEILANRDLFISKRVEDAFIGFALAQLKRIRTHRGWLLNPPKKKPERADFNLPDIAISDDEMGALGALQRSGVKVELASELMQILTKEKEYQAAKRHWDSYMNWKTNRNPARAELEARSGYDTKHGLHLVRLLRMGIEILSGKGVIVKRPDAQELLDIRNGAWSFEVLEAWAEKAFETAKLAALSSALPARPDMNKLDTLCIKTIEEALGFYQPLFIDSEGDMMSSTQDIDYDYTY